MPRRRSKNRQLDQFADILAGTAGSVIDGNVREVARLLGINAKRGNNLMQQLRREIGTSQAR